MANQRRVIKALLKSSVVAAASSIAVMVGAIAFDHHIAIQNDDAIKDRGAFFSFVLWWTAIPSGVATFAAVAGFEAMSFVRPRYTLSEAAQKVIESGGSEILAADLLALEIRSEDEQPN